MLKNEYIVTWELYKEWIKDSKFRGIRLVFAIFWGLLAIASTAIFFLLDTSVFYIVIILFCLYRVFLHDYVVGRKTYARQTQVCGQEKWTRTITITGDGIEITDGTANVKYKNSNVLKVVEKGDLIRLDMIGRMSLRLYKSAVIEGSWESCKSYYPKND